MLSILSQIVSVIAGILIIGVGFIMLFFWLYGTKKEDGFSKGWEDQKDDDDYDL